ncbi:lamin tail domain-containing protein [Flavihumibacter profundi]|uniref:lamin tail domain-containing protein n=1 Tax=Flavihumibacter profundi TaxID=2716883 RepID=UPI001CC675AB|nr:lamin tail domain-containing protein [Flavihumibacter profundi]MBZ5858745.1 lamin tail domain-containing protein [Flavihumibacter profundi]
MISAGTHSAQAFQVVITELLPDPVPAISLPPEEFIELTNVSGKIIDISGWLLSNGRTTAVFPDSTFLPPDSILIVCSTRAFSQYLSYGRTIALTKYPVLSNDGDTILLFDRNQNLIHAVAYSIKSYGGVNTNGRSLEMIDLKKACSIKGNWQASESEAGGSPGKPSLAGISRDKETGFNLLYGFTKGNDKLVLVFDDVIDAASVANIKAIESEPWLDFTGLTIDGPLHNQLVCQLAGPLLPHKVYALQANSIRSCQLYPPGNTRRVKLGLADSIATGMVINELLFDPPPTGCDYVELYNTGQQIIDLQQLKLANRNNRGEISSSKSISTSPRYFCPGEYIVCTENKGWLSKQYLVKDPITILELEKLPSWPNETGSVVLLDGNNKILDELNYQSGWQFELLGNKEGIALERRNPTGKTQDRDNWFSAAMNVGYGTPGYANSQFTGNTFNGIKIWPEPALFSPDGDGKDDFCHIRYSFNEPGYVLTTLIYNRNGILVRSLARNGLCGIQGQFSWDGKDDKKNQLPPGIYIAVTDIFSVNGKTRRWRHAITLVY